MPTAHLLDKFSWLQLSDFHFKADGDLFSQQVSTEAILKDIPSRLSSEHPLQFVVVTGDIAFSGKSREYDLAAEFFKSLASALGLAMDRIFICPGNHDVDRSVQEFVYGESWKDSQTSRRWTSFLGVISTEPHCWRDKPHSEPSAINCSSTEPSKRRTTI